MNFILFSLVLLEASEPGRWINKDDFVQLHENHADLLHGGTKPLDVKSFSTIEGLREEIQRIKKESFANSEYTKQQANSQFGKILLKKINSLYFRRKMRKEIDQELTKWSTKSQSQFAAILKKYFMQVLEKDVEFEVVLQEIMATAKDLNQISTKKPNCFQAIYEGELKALFNGEEAQKAMPEQVSREKSLEWIRQTFINGERTRQMQVHHNDENLFAGSGDPYRTKVKQSTTFEKLKNLEFSGCLDTYNSKTDKAGFEPLMNLFHFAEQVTEGDDELTVANLTYLIWKTTGYSTPDHQDIHRQQHLVSYHQLRGQAFFHILPPICGLFLARLYIEKKVDKIKEALLFFDAQGIGFYTYLRAGEVIYLPPDKTHFVQVPYEEGNQRIDYVRAFEILFEYESMDKELLNKVEPKRKVKKSLKDRPQQSTSIEETMHGVYAYLGKKWIAKRTLAGKTVVAGPFSDLGEAKSASDSLVLNHKYETGKKRKHRLNFPKQKLPEKDLEEIVQIKGEIPKKVEQIISKAIGQSQREKRTNFNERKCGVYRIINGWVVRKEIEGKISYGSYYLNLKEAMRASGLLGLKHAHIFNFPKQNYMHTEKDLEEFFAREGECVEKIKSIDCFKPKEKCEKPHDQFQKEKQPQRNQSQTIEIVAENDNDCLLSAEKQVKSKNARKSYKRKRKENLRDSQDKTLVYLEVNRLVGFLENIEKPPGYEKYVVYFLQREGHEDNVIDLAFKTYYKEQGNTLNQQPFSLWSQQLPLNFRINHFHQQLLLQHQGQPQEPLCHRQSQLPFISNYYFNMQQQYSYIFKA